MPTTTRNLAEAIGSYLRSDITLEQLVDWAETALMDAEFDPEETDALRSVAARLGLADVREFGLTWEDCRDLLRQLGYAAHVDIRLASPAGSQFGAHSNEPAPPGGLVA